MTLLGVHSLADYDSLSWINFSWVESSQIPDRRTGVDTALMHAPWILDRLRSILQYCVLLVEDDSAVQLRHIVGWIVGSSMSHHSVIERSRACWIHPSRMSRCFILPPKPVFSRGPLAADASMKMRIGRSMAMPSSSAMYDRCSALD